MKSLIAFGIIAGLALGCSSGYDNQRQQASTTVNTSAPAKPSEQKPEIKTVKVGEPIEIGGIQFTVKGVEKLDKVQKPNPDSKFVAIQLEAKNTGKEPQLIADQLFTLVDKDNRVFESNTTSIIPFSDSAHKSFGFDKLNPGLSKTGYVAFELPGDVTKVGLAIKDNMFDFGGAKYVFVVLGDI